MTGNSVKAVTSRSTTFLNVFCVRQRAVEVEQKDGQVFSLCNKKLNLLQHLVFNMNVI